MSKISELGSFSGSINSKKLLSALTPKRANIGKQSLSDFEKIAALSNKEDNHFQLNIENYTLHQNKHLLSTADLERWDNINPKELICLKIEDASNMDWEDGNKELHLYVASKRSFEKTMTKGYEDPGFDRECFLVCRINASIYDGKIHELVLDHIAVKDTLQKNGLATKVLTLSLDSVKQHLTSDATISAEPRHGGTVGLLNTHDGEESNYHFGGDVKSNVMAMLAYRKEKEQAADPKAADEPSPSSTSETSKQTKSDTRDYRQRSGPGLFQKAYDQGLEKTDPKDSAPSDRFEAN